MVNYFNQKHDGHEHDGYDEFLEVITNRFNSYISQGKKLFTTNATGLHEAYLNNIPVQDRQYYTCHACRHFIERFGGLVSINEYGEMESVIWEENNEIPFFNKSIKAMKKLILSSRINGVFVSDVKTLGTPITGEWTHFAVKLPKQMVNNSRLLTAGQVMAQKVEDFKMLTNALLSYDINNVNQAVELLETEALYRGDKCLGVAKWFKDLIEKRNNVKSHVKPNIVWLAVATAPNGFCHIRSSMIGTLLEDIASGMSFESVSRRFAEKMNPSNYMRTQTAPTQGNIEQAEKIVAKLGIANSLKRRYAKFEEIPSFIWKNNLRGLKRKTGALEESTGGVFGNITPKQKAETHNTKMNLPTSVMTFEKFQRTILPTAENIEVLVDNPNRLMALVTASDKTAENILQWNNPFSWYYHGGIDGEIKRRVEQAGGKYENNEIRCSLVWEGFTDLDLHCITPNGEHIHFANKRGRCGGWLDIDMNGGSHRDNSPVENIRWTHNAPKGNYKFYVHNYCERGMGTTPFKVELEINGQIYTYNGVAGSTSYKTTAFEFYYVKGRQPTIKSDSVTSDDSWTVSKNSFVKVNGITNSPNLWDKEPVKHIGSHIFFLLDGCQDSSEGKGRGFFNETLKPELREIRKTLEAYTANTPIEDSDEATACGIGCSKDSDWNLTLRVTSNNSTRLIKIDRLD